MSIQSRFRSLLRNLTTRRQVERALDDEVQGYLDLLTDEKIAAGMAADVARRAARIEMGGADQVKEAVRDVRAGASIDELLLDVRYSLRMLRRAPAFTAVAVITLALGIGANTAIFSVVDAVLLRPLAVADPERLVAIYRGSSGASGAFSYPEYLEYREAAHVFSGLAAWGSGNRLWFRNGGDLERATAQLVSGNFFDVLGVRAAVGRTFVAGEDPPAGLHPVAVISDAFWRQRFGADPHVPGRPVTLNGQAFTVIGVMPRGFVGLDPGSSPDVWVPIAALQVLEPDWAYRERQELWIRLTGRLRDGVALTQGEASLQAMPSPASSSPETASSASIVRLVPAGVAVFDPGARASSLRLAWILMAVVASVLLIACANVANLLLARSAARRRELGVRLAIGATRGRVARQVLTESLVLAVIGGVAGLAVAHWTIGLLVTLAPAAAIPPGVAVAIDTRVLSFAMITSIVTGLLFGVGPAWQLSRLDALRVIKGCSSSNDARHRVVAAPGRRLLVTTQVALSVVLLIGASLFVRTLAAASSVTSGYDTSRVLLISIDLNAPGSSATTAMPVLDRALDAVSAIHGVEAASAGQIVPFSGAFIGRPASAEGQAIRAAEADPFIAPYNVISSGYFRTLGAPLRGRDFAATDDAMAPRVAIVNETMARRLWPGQEAIGKRMYLPLREQGPSYEIIGVVQDGKYVSLTEEQRPYMYLPITQHFRPRLTLHVRTSGEPASFAPQVRQALRGAAADLPAFNVFTLDDHVRRSLGRERLLARLLTVFGAVALAIAAVGIYGVLSYTVARRTRELGVRMALGARPVDIARLVVGQGAALIVAGLGLGIAASLALTRVLETFLFGVTPTDPVAFTIALLLFTAVALVATCVPAFRAAHVDPLAALRTE
jgi:predicted permease